MAKAEKQKSTGIMGPIGAFISVALFVLVMIAAIGFHIASQYPAIAIVVGLVLLGLAFYYRKRSAFFKIIWLLIVIGLVLGLLYALGSMYAPK